MKETEIKVMNDDETRDFCIRKDYEIFKKEKEIERLNNIINEYDKYALAIAKIRDLNNSLLNDKNFREMLNEVLEELKGSESNE